MPALEPRLIFDNAACRVGKGTHFSLDRLSFFLREHFKKHGSKGYFLKCDIKKYFENISHTVLKNKLIKVFEPDIYNLLCKLIESYNLDKGKGLPLGNQASQWFALYYLDGIDRLIKEKLRIKHYVRYMDDFVLLHQDKDYRITNPVHAPYTLSEKTAKNSLNVINMKTNTNHCKSKVRDMKEKVG